MRISENCTISSVCGENIVLRQGTLNQDMTQVISLNDTAVELWNQFEGKDFTVADAAKYLVETYGIEMERALGDAQKWADKLISAQVLK